MAALVRERANKTGGGAGLGRGLSAAVFSPGEDTIAALDRAASLLPIEFTIYADAANMRTVKSQASANCYKLVQTENTISELSASLFGGRARGDVAPGNKAPSGKTRSQNFFHFLVRGDLLSLEETYQAISPTRQAISVPREADLPCPAESPPAVAQERPAESPPALFLSHVAAFEAASLSRVLLISDGFVNQNPDLATRLAIIRNGLKVCEEIGISQPKVALLAAVEQVYPGMPVTVESSEIAKMAAGGAIEGALVEGPLSFDVALDEEVARDKGVPGRVAGKADLLVGSSIEVISGIYMAQTVLARAMAASVVVGGRAPLALPFPSDCVDNIFYSLCLAGLLSTGPRQTSLP